MRAVNWRRARGRKVFPHALANRHALSLTGMIGRVRARKYDRRHDGPCTPETFGRNINRCRVCFCWWTDALVSA